MQKCCRQLFLFSSIFFCNDLTYCDLFIFTTFRFLNLWSGFMITYVDGLFMTTRLLNLTILIIHLFSFDDFHPWNQWSTILPTCHRSLVITLMVCPTGTLMQVGAFAMWFGYSLWISKCVSFWFDVLCKWTFFQTSSHIALCEDQHGIMVMNSM